MSHRPPSDYYRLSTQERQQSLLGGALPESENTTGTGNDPHSNRNLAQPGPGPSSSAFTPLNPPKRRMDRKSPTPMSDPRGTASPGQETSTIKRVGGKANVSSACGPCKRAHLACDVARPCKRCVNMGKEDQCEDVPHKKRGRPKVPKPALGEPYHRARPPQPDHGGNGGVGKWRGPSAYDAPYMSTVDAPPPPLVSMGGRNSPPIPRPLGVEGDPAFSAPPQPNTPFTIFTTTEFKILRASPMSYHLIGYHPNEFVNLNLLDWIHPNDRHFVENERIRLITVPYVESQLKSIEVTHTAMTQRTEIELLSPAEGMREPYPNKNVRVLHSDGRFSPFNVRLHLGGGLGASLWQPNTLGRIYLVISFLPIPQPRDLPREGPPPSSTIVQPVRRTSGMAPPTPITPVPGQPMTAGGQGLPGFSAIAAAADAPPTRYDQPPPQAYYPPPPPPQQGPSRQPMTAQPAYPYPRSGPMAIPPPGGPGIPLPYGRRSASPNSTYRTPQTSTYPTGPPEYPQQQAYYPPAPDQSQSFRRPSDEEQWRNANPTMSSNGGGGGNPAMSGRPGQPQTQAQGHGQSGLPQVQGQLPPGGLPNDGSRRAWEL